MPKYAGSDWIKRNFKVQMSPLGEKVADLLGDLYLGIYHVDDKALKKVEWSNPHRMEFVLGWVELATTDCDELTRLVILCHDRLVRCSIRPRSFKYICLTFSERINRDGHFYERHPTIEQAIKHTRAMYEVTNAH